MGQFNMDLQMSQPALYGKDDDEKKKGMKMTRTVAPFDKKKESALGKLTVKREAKITGFRGKKNAEIPGAAAGVEFGAPMGLSVKKSKGIIEEPQSRIAAEKKAKKDSGTSPLGELGMSGNATKRFPDKMLKVNKKYQKRVNTVLGR